MRQADDAADAAAASAGAGAGAVLFSWCYKYNAPVMGTNCQPGQISQQAARKGDTERRGIHQPKW